MKRTLLPLLLLLTCASTLSAQEEKQFGRLYFRGGLGFATRHGGDVQGPLYSLTSGGSFPLSGSQSSSSLPTNTFNNYNLNKVSFSSGLQGVLAMGMSINKNLAVEIDANVGLNNQQAKTDIKDVQAQSTYYVTVKQQANSFFFLTPSFVVQTGGKVNIYARGGITLPIQSAVTQQVDYRSDTYNPADSSTVTKTISLTEDYHMRLTPGFSGAMGAQLRVGRMVSVWAEAGVLSMTLYYKRSVLTGYSQDGVSVFNQIAPSQRETVYNFKGTAGGSSNNLPTSQVPFSNFNISAGIKVDLL